MKINYLFFLLFIALGCNESPTQDHSQTEVATTEEKNNTTEVSSTDVKQNGDYTSLFNNPDCNVITAEEISSALGLVFKDMQVKGSCSFQTEFPNNKSWFLSILRYEMSKSDILREINNFKSDESGQLAIEISESGETYFCIQHNNGYLSIFNTNYSSSFLIRYGSIGESRGFSKEERLVHKDLAVKLANTILMKHQK